MMILACSDIGMKVGECRGGTMTAVSYKWEGSEYLDADWTKADCPEADYPETDYPEINLSVVGLEGISSPDAAHPETV